MEKDENERLKTLTQAASPSIKTIKTKGVVALEKDLSWRNLLEKDQGIEWFDADGKLLAKEGSIFFNYPCPLISQLAI
ncbi:MAG: hypothetical protein HC874_04755 [Richelia sp. SL_2_1]|nr:hypothetical protein [Richelia sp. SL_2_1]